MKDRLKEIEENASREIEDAQDKEVLESLRIRYLGRKGIITQILRGLKDLPPENRPDIGQTANQVKLHITSLLQKNLEVMRKIEEEKEEEVFFDTTLPGENSL
jgi:phenylalanyl-tRNA synthetase alpha chain